MENLDGTDSYRLTAVATLGGGGGNLTAGSSGGVRYRPVKGLDEVVGQSPGIAALRERIARLVARASDVRRLPPVLIQGETGTGKGLVAQALHRAGPRAAGPFVDVNCAAIPESLLEAEMFGFERGAFTDARQAKRGLFQTAHQGTLFLDEIGLLSEGLQAKLLKVIEERVVRRLGSTQGEPVDVWILAATNADLAAAVRGRRFREDLYHRLAVLTLVLPPLRERGDDVILLAEHFLARACGDYGLPSKAFAPDARAALAAHRWPGNVRELANVMERVALLSEAPVVTADVVGLPVAEEAAPAADGDTGPAGVAQPPRPLVDAMAGVERAHLFEALQATGWNVSRTALRLGISRNTLRYRMEKHALRPGTAPVRPRTGARTGSPVPSPAPAAAPVMAPAAPAPSSIPSAVRWERRRLSLLRAALEAGPAEGGPIGSSRVLEMLVDKVQSFGGRVEELGASGVVAVFGLAPLEHAAWRAANAALAILRATTASDGPGEPLPVRLGLHVSALLVGRVGDVTQMEADGKRDAWRVLDSLVAAADPRAIVVSPAAAPFLERRFDLVSTGGGSRVGAAGYRLSRSERPLFEPGRRLIPFVGRQSDLQHLRGRLASAVAGRGQLVGVVGESGIGKSRLLHEFYLSAAGQRVTYLEAHCFDYGTATPYLPVLEIIRHACRVTESDGPETVTEKVRGGLEEAGLNPAEHAPYVLHLLGVKEGTDALPAISPDAIRGRTLDAIRRLIVLQSRRRPLVIAIEDLQWVDGASGELIMSLADAAQGAPILFVATYRPGYRPPWLDRSYASQVAIGPLDAGESLAVVRSVLPETAPAPVATLILERAQGNPFFLEELARTLAEGGAPGRTSDTVQETILARIDRLSEPARRLVQSASVLGPEVSARVLRAMWETGPEVDALLRELIQQEILDERGGGAEAGHVFRHSLTQEIVYGSLVDADRRRWHAAAGRALETLYREREEEVLERLAYHFGRSDDGDRAVDYALRAAEKAQRRWAHAEAAAHFESALQRLDALPDTPANHLRRIDGVIRQAEVKVAMGRHAEQIAALEGIGELVEQTADPARRAAWHYWVGFLHSFQGDRPELSIARCQEAASIAGAAGLDDIRAFADCCLAHVYLVAGDLQGALRAGEAALATFEARGNVWWTCRSLWALSPAANALGQWERSLAYCERALALGRAADDLRLKVVGWWRTGAAHVFRGDPDTGLRCLGEASALSPTPFDAATIASIRGYARLKRGEAEAGMRELQEAWQWFDRSQLRYTRSLVALRLAEGYLVCEEPARARAFLTELRDVCGRFGYRYLEGVVHRLLGETWIEEDHTAAGRHLDAAVAILEAIDARNELAKAFRAQAVCRRRAGEPAGASALLQRALEIFEALGTADEIPRVQALLAAV